MKSFSILFTESVKEVEDLNEQIQLLDEMPGANMDTRAVHQHLKKQGWKLTRSSGSHDVFTHPEAKHHIPVPRHRQLKAPLVKGILKQSDVRNEEVEIQECESLEQNFELINEISVGAKIRAYAKHSRHAYEHGDMGNDDESDHHNARANKIIAHIEKHHGKEAVKHAERAAHSAIFGHPDHEHSGKDVLSGGLRGNKNLTKAGKIPKNTVSAMKNKVMPYGKPRNTAGPKSKLPEEVEQLEESKGLWANIHAKRERIKNGSGERMRKPGSEGAPSEEDLKNSQVKEEVELDEADKHSFIGKIQRGQELKKKVDSSFSDIGDAQKKGDRSAASKAFRKHERYANLERPGTWTKVKEDTLQEGRPSQRHPLEGHEYHKKTDAELEYIAKDAHKAAEAMKSHNTDAENKYRDQANDSATVRYFRKKNGMPNWYKKKYGHIKEDNVINTNSPNSVLNNPATQQATQTNITKKKQVIDRYTTGRSSGVSGTTVVASPRESVEIQEGRMKSMADDDFHPTVTKSAPPFDGPYKTKPKNVTDKSGAVHTPMSRVKNLARQAARKNGGLKEDNDNTLSSYDKEDTPAKKTLSKTAGMVKDLADKAKTKAKTKKSDDTFQPEPELASNIVR